MTKPRPLGGRPGPGTRRDRTVQGRNPGSGEKKPGPIQEKQLCAQELESEYKGHKTIFQTNLFHGEIKKIYVTLLGDGREA